MASMSLGQLGPSQPPIPAKQNLMWAYEVMKRRKREGKVRPFVVNLPTWVHDKGQAKGALEAQIAGVERGPYR